MDNEITIIWLASQSVLIEKQIKSENFRLVMIRRLSRRLDKLIKWTKQEQSKP